MNDKYRIEKYEFQYCMYKIMQRNHFRAAHIMEIQQI